MCQLTGTHDSWTESVGANESGAVKAWEDLIHGRFLQRIARRLGWKLTVEFDFRVTKPSEHLLHQLDHRKLSTRSPGTVLYASLTTPIKEVGTRLVDLPSHSRSTGSFWRFSSPSDLLTIPQNLKQSLSLDDEIPMGILDLSAFFLEHYW